MKKIVALLLVITLASCKSKVQHKVYTKEETIAESKKVNDYLDSKFDEAVARNPETASSMGLKTGYDSWSDRSDENSDKEFAIQKAVIDSLKSKFNLVALDNQTKLSFRMLQEDVKRSEEGRKWRHYGYEITQMGGVHNDLPSFLINIHRVDSLSDAQAYLSRLKKA